MARSFGVVAGGADDTGPTAARQGVAAGLSTGCVFGEGFPRAPAMPRHGLGERLEIAAREARMKLRQDAVLHPLHVFAPAFGEVRSLRGARPGEPRPESLPGRIELLEGSLDEKQLPLQRRLFLVGR